ncbi:MAG: hypothetical protein ACREJO_13845, partial [Phycisphaerales bacterium]
AEGERNAKLTTAAYQDALARQAQKDQWLSIGGSVLTAGGNLVGASVGVPGLGTLLGGAVVAGFGGIAYQQRQKKKAAEQTAEQNAADAAEKEAIVLSVVKAVAALGKDHPAMAAELKGYLRDHVTGAADDVIETLKRENGVIDLVKAPQIKLAA